MFRASGSRHHYAACTVKSPFKVQKVSGATCLESEPRWRLLGSVAPPHIWCLIVVLSVSISVIASLAKNTTAINQPRHEQWYWDQNIYHDEEKSTPTGDSAAAIATKPGNVIVQVVPDAVLQPLADLSSRPNRAYARQWSIDFAMYVAGTESPESTACFRKVEVLESIFRGHYPNGSSPSPHARSRSYNHALLLPADAVLVELDTDIIANTLPSNKLVAIAGWEAGDSITSKSGIFAFNLDHHYAGDVLRWWLDSTQTPKLSCGANNDLNLLLAAINNVMNASEALSDLVHPIPESSDGFVGNRLVKFIPTPVPGPHETMLRESVRESSTRIQETVGSVCYRFYPRCEVLTPS